MSYTADHQQGAIQMFWAVLSTLEVNQLNSNNTVIMQWCFIVGKFLTHPSIFDYRLSWWGCREDWSQSLLFWSEGRVTL